MYSERIQAEGCNTESWRQIGGYKIRELQGVQVAPPSALSVFNGRMHEGKYIEHKQISAADLLRTVAEGVNESNKDVPSLFVNIAPFEGHANCIPLMCPENESKKIVLLCGDITSVNLHFVDLKG